RPPAILGRGLLGSGDGRRCRRPYPQREARCPRRSGDLRPGPQPPRPRSLPAVTVAAISRVRALGFGGAVKALVALELAVIAVGAIATVARFPVFALVDERAHYS